MPDDLASANVNRSYSLAATSIAIFTFSLTFLYPRYVNGELNAPLFQVTLVAMGLATFSFVLAAFLYYGTSLGSRIDEDERATYARRGDRLWMAGISLLFVVPSLILFTVRLEPIGAVWLVLWLAYIAFAIRYFPRVQTSAKP